MLMTDGEWFLSNTMDLYCCLALVVVLVILANTVYHLFNACSFTSSTKQGGFSKRWYLALHVFSPDDSDKLALLYRNRPPAPFLDNFIENFFAMFARVIFSDQIERFFTEMAENGVLLLDLKIEEI